jgi:cytochrome c-type biogenesis protein
MIDNINIFFVFTAGLMSVLSPCVLPIVPIVVTGNNNEHKWRPMLVVSGLSLTFIILGVLSSLFGSVIGPKMLFIEKIAGILIAIFGILLLFNVNLFKHLSFFSRFAQKSKGRFGGFFLGLTLGIIWIPCVGPMLSSVLALVATEGKMAIGIFMLLIYSAGFSIPLLLAGYASQFFRKRLRSIGKFPYTVNLISGLILIGLGLFIIFRGILGFAA